ncbi:MAG: TVP38/TMEM64 family protein [Kiloniellaceae bacterium]
MGDPTGRTVRRARSLGRVIPLTVLVAGFALFFALDLDRFLTFAALHENREWLVAQVEAHGLLATLTFTVIYTLVIAFSIPGGAILTITAGFLFGTLLAAACAVVGGTIGAAGVFLAARTAFADVLRAKAGPALRRMETGFRENAMSYLLVLRLIPLFPFWLVNLVPAFLGVTPRTYVVGTFFGIIPGTLVYASLGNGLGAILDAGETPDLKIIFEPEILIPIIALAILALLPVVYKRVKARRGRSD